MAVMNSVLALAIVIITPTNKVLIAVIKKHNKIMSLVFFLTNAGFVIGMKYCFITTIAINFKFIIL